MFYAGYLPLLLKNLTYPTAQRIRVLRWHLHIIPRQSLPFADNADLLDIDPQVQRQTTILLAVKVANSARRDIVYAKLQANERLASASRASNPPFTPQAAHKTLGNRLVFNNMLL